MRSFLARIQRHAPWLKLVLVLTIIIIAAVTGGAPDVTDL